jgi:hypothetical protein
MDIIPICGAVIVAPAIAWHFAGKKTARHL